MTFHVTELCRVTTGPMRSTSADGNNGSFDLESPESGWRLAIIASDGKGWEHVSIHAYQRGRGGVEVKTRVPNWREMCYVKDLFWDEDDTVMQIHPPKSQYINQHQKTLHLWRPTFAAIPLPHPAMVGLREGQTYVDASRELEAYDPEKESA